jgi:hypothetical protein
LAWLRWGLSTWSSGILNNLEIELFINELEIENPNEIFFVEKVSLK